MTLRYLSVSLAGLLALAIAAPARSGEGAPPIAVRHGIALDRSLVGPTAHGAWTPVTAAGTEIRDGRNYPFAKRIESARTYDGHPVSAPHLLIENVTFTGPVDVYARHPVVFRRVSISPTKAAPWALHTRPEAGPILFLWSGTSAATAGHLQRGLYLRSSSVTVYRSHLHRAGDGIQIHAPHVRVLETLIDDLTAAPGDHNDGIQLLGQASDVEIALSRIVNRHPQTSCLNLAGSRITVTDTYLSGGGWTVYGGAQVVAGGGRPPHTVRIEGNIFGRDLFPKGGNFGVIAYWDNSPGAANIWSRNTFLTGEPVLRSDR